MTRLRVLFTASFWLDASERGIKSFGQGAVGALGQDVLGADVFHASPGNVALAGASMAILSILTSVASAPVAGMSPASLAPPGA